LDFRGGGFECKEQNKIITLLTSKAKVTLKVMKTDQNYAYAKTTYKFLLKKNKSLNIV
jgi:hypothetical protein